MAKKYLRILISYENCLYSFVNIEAVSRDGSIIITLRRDGKNNFRASWSNQPGKEIPTRIDFPEPREKNKKLTIHASGRINFPDSRDSPIFIEPLVYISKPFSFYAYRIPHISALSKFSKLPDVNDKIICLDELPGSAQSFEFIISPSDYVLTGNAIKIEYLQKYALIIMMHANPLQVPAEYEKYFTTFAVGPGLFQEQAIDENEALIAYHQALTNTKGLIIYAPNVEGEWRVIFPVPTRIAPKVIIEPSNPELFIEVIDQSLDVRTHKAQLRFMVRERKTRKIIHEIISFQKFILDAEL